MTAVATRSRVLRTVLDTPFECRAQDAVSALCPGLQVNEIWSMHIFPRCDERARRILQRVNRSWCAQLRMYEKKMPIRVERLASVNSFMMYPGLTQFTARLPTARHRLSDIVMLRRLTTLTVSYYGPLLDVTCLAKLPNLRHLCIGGPYKSVRGLGALTQLHTLNITFCEDNINDQLLALKDTLRALTLAPSRSIIFPFRDEGVFVSAETVEQMEHLHTFGIAGASVEKQKWKPLLNAFVDRKCAKKSILLHDDRELQNYGAFYHMAKDTTWLSLKRSACLDFVWLNIQLARFTNLTHLSFSGFTSPSAPDVMIHELNIPTLRSLDVVSSIGDMVVNMFTGETLSRLERLSIYAYDYRALQQQTKNLDSLEYLAMKHQNVTDTAIATRRLPRLRYLELAICSDFKAFTDGPPPKMHCFTRGFYANVPVELQMWFAESTEVQVPVAIEAFCSTSFPEANSPVLVDDQIGKICLRKACLMNARDYAHLGLEHRPNMVEEESSFSEPPSSDSEDDEEESESSSDSEELSDESSSDSDSEWYDPARRKKTSLKRTRPLPFRAPNERLAAMSPDDSFSPSLDSSSDDERRYRARRRKR